VGATLKLAYRRGTENREGAVVTEPLESRVGEPWAFEKWGLSVRSVSRTYARENQLAAAAGLIVIGVQAGYPAAVAGLARGDIITKINGQPITTLDEARQAHAAYEAKPGPTLVETSRNHRVSLYVLKP